MSQPVDDWSEDERANSAHAIGFREGYKLAQENDRAERDSLKARLKTLIDAALQAREALDDADASTRKMLDAIHAVDAAVAEARK